MIRDFVNVFEGICLVVSLLRVFCALGSKVHSCWIQSYLCSSVSLLSCQNNMPKSLDNRHLPKDHEGVSAESNFWSLDLLVQNIMAGSGYFLGLLSSYAASVWLPIRRNVQQ